MLNISKIIYMGWNTVKQLYMLPEAEVVPYGDSVREQKKLIEITAKYTELKEFDNIPLPGFTLYSIDNKKYTSAKVTWLVIDPRGVLVNISSENLQSILAVTGITEGLIQQKCIWARNDSDTKVHLVPMSSEAYAKAVENTGLIENKVDIKDVDIGDTVLLQNGLQGVYMGVASLYGTLDDYRVRDKYKVLPRRNQQILEKEPGRYFYSTDIGILKVIEKSKIPLSSQDAIDRMNATIVTHGNGYFSNSPRINNNFSHFYYNMGGFIKLVSSSSVSKVSITYEEISLAEATTLFLQAEVIKDIGMLAVEDSAGEKHIIDFPFTVASIRPAALTVMPKFHVCNIIPLDDKHIMLGKGRRSIWGGKGSRLPGHSLTDFKKFYKIVKHVKKETYI